MSDPKAIADIVEGALMIVGVFFAPVVALLPGARKIAEGIAGRKAKKSEKQNDFEQEESLDVE